MRYWVIVHINSPNHLACNSVHTAFCMPPYQYHALDWTRLIIRWDRSWTFQFIWPMWRDSVLQITMWALGGLENYVRKSWDLGNVVDITMWVLGEEFQIVMCPGGGGGFPFRGGVLKCMYWIILKYGRNCGRNRFLISVSYLEIFVSLYRSEAL